MITPLEANNNNNNKTPQQIKAEELRKTLLRKFSKLEKLCLFKPRALRNLF